MPFSGGVVPWHIYVLCCHVAGTPAVVVSCFPDKAISELPNTRDLGFRIQPDSGQMCTKVS